MNTNIPAFRKNSVRPIECLKSGWALIKDQYWLFVGISVVALLLGSIAPLGLLMGPMMCGLYLCLLARARGETVKFDMLFKGFDFFLEGFIATLFQIIPIVIVVFPVYIAFTLLIMFTANTQRAGGGFPIIIFIAFGAAFILVMLFAIVLGALFAFAYPLIVDRKMSGLAAVKTSVRAVMGNLGGILGLVFLNTLMGFVGVLFCYVGVFLVLPISFAGIAVAFHRVFPREGLESFSAV